MANLKAKDADSVNKFIKSTGTGTDDDPYVVEHSNLPALQQLQQTVAQLNTIVGQLGDIGLIKSQLQTLISVSGTINNFPTNQPVTVSNFPTTQPVSGSVTISNFPTTQPVSGSVTISNFPTTQPVSGSVTISNFPNAQSITDSQQTIIETLLALGANGNFTSNGRDAFNKNTVRGWVFTNVNGTLYVDQSINNSSWRQIETIPITGNAAQATDFMFRLSARYYRLRYVNGNTAQTSFELISTMFGVGL